MDEPQSLTQRAALARTRLALDRTLMAWLRTAIALITFGFTLSKAADYARALGIEPAGALLGVNPFALIMVIVGVFAVLLATVEHIRHARTLQKLDVRLSVFSAGTLLALLFAALGTFALISIFLRRR